MFFSSVNLFTLSITSWILWSALASMILLAVLLFIHVSVSWVIGELTGGSLGRGELTLSSVLKNYVLLCVIPAFVAGFIWSAGLPIVGVLSGFAVLVITLITMNAIQRRRRRR